MWGGVRGGVWGGEVKWGGMKGHINSTIPAGSSRTACEIMSGKGSQRGVIRGGSEGRSGGRVS